LLQQILNHPRLTLFSTGNSRNLQWVHVCDLAEAVELAGTQAAATNHIFNIAGRELFSLRDLMTIARLYTGEGLRKTAFSPWDRSGDNSGLKYDLSKAYNRLGFMPRIKLRDGIEEILVTFGST
jgi:nucleoside-diphosphate-sugar epimerase